MQLGLTEQSFFCFLELFLEKNYGVQVYKSNNNLSRTFTDRC